MTLIEALRCSATVRPSYRNCAECPYRVLEPVHPEMPCPTDIVIGGVEYWEICDMEKMAIDAADELEKVALISETIRQIHDNVAKENYNKGYAQARKDLENAT